MNLKSFQAFIVTILGLGLSCSTYAEEPRTDDSKVIVAPTVSERSVGEKSKQTTTFSTRKSGGMTDGGGCGILVSESLVLKDFYRAQRLNRNALNEALFHEGDQISRSQVIQYLGYAHLDGSLGNDNVADYRSYKLAIETLEKWKDLHPVIMEYLTNILEQIPFYGIDYSIGPHLFGCKNMGNYTIAGYGGGPYAMTKRRVIISIPNFNRATLKSQAGVFIKEAIRFMQFSYPEAFVHQGLTEVSEQVVSDFLYVLFYGQPDFDVLPVSSLFVNFDDLSNQRLPLSTQLMEQWSEAMLYTNVFAQPSLEVDYIGPKLYIGSKSLEHPTIMPLAKLYSRFGSDLPLPLLILAMNLLENEPSPHYFILTKVREELEKPIGEQKVLAQFSARCVQSANRKHCVNVGDEIYTFLGALIFSGNTSMIDLLSSFRETIRLSVEPYILE